MNADVNAALIAGDLQVRFLRMKMNWKIYNETQQSKPKSDSDFITLR
jgi:hypothetical protein